MKQEIKWQWHQLYHMQITCTLLQTDNHTSTAQLSWMPFPPPKKQRQSTEMLYENVLHQLLVIITVKKA